MGEKTTTIKQIINEDRDSETAYLLFVDLENTSPNRYISPGSYTEVNCAVPWCSSHDEFLKKGIIITNRFKTTVLGCIWQHQNRVRLQKSGWDLPSSGNLIPGYSEAGGLIDLKIDSQGNISAEQVQEKSFAVEVGEEDEIPVERASR